MTTTDQKLMFSIGWAAGFNARTQTTCKSCLQVPDGCTRSVQLDDSELLRRIMDVVAAEREACIRTLERLISGDGIVAEDDCVAALRARGAAPEGKA